MKRYYLKQVICYGLFYFIFISSSSAQVNYVGDPSFEDTSSTVNGDGQMSLKQWRNLDSTRSYPCRFVYMSYITQNPPYALPDNQWCHQHPRSGGGVVDLDFIWANNPTIKRSVPRIKLVNALQAGKTYCAKMYVNPCDKYGDYFTDGIAMYFDNGQLDTIVAIDSLGIYPFVHPQVSNPNGNVLNDTINWTLVSGVFTATGNETFLTIGNFKTDSNTLKVINWAVYNPLIPVNGSSLLIDDVSVVEVALNNWLTDLHCTIGDSVYIGLPPYEIPDALWYDINMNYLGKGSGIKIKASVPLTKFIQAIDVCSDIRYDTVTVYANPLSIKDIKQTGVLEVDVFPNPSQDKIYIKSQDDRQSQLMVKIYDVEGRLLIHKEGKFTNNIYSLITNLNDGIYFIGMTDQETKESIVKKVIVKK